MRIPRPATWILSILLFFVTAACLYAADLSTSSASTESALKSSWLQMAIVVLVPAVIAGLKQLWPSVPRPLIPFLCPVIGVAVDQLAGLAGQDLGSVELSGAFGALGLYLRELLTQSKKAVNGMGQASMVAFAALMISAGGVRAGEHRAQRFSVTPFASYRVHEFGAQNGKFGGGLAAGFTLTSRLTLEAEVLAERFDDSHWIESLTEAGANFKFYVLPGKRVNPYALLGYSRSLDRDENRMNAGAGVELRLCRNASLFTDGRWTHDFERVGHALFRGGVNVRF